MMSMLRRTAVVCAIAVLATVGGTAATAQAAVGDVPVEKIRTIWEYALNIGQNDGTFAQGAQAQIWYNRHHDWNSRWLIHLNHNDGWYLYENLYTRLCLAATGTWYDAPVVQTSCNAADPKQQWRDDATIAYFVGFTPVRNRWLTQQSPTNPLVLTQRNNWNGSAVTTRPWTGSFYQYWHRVPCGMRSGFSPNYNFNTPQDC